jgi:hypothetical protein
VSENPAFTPGLRYLTAALAAAERVTEAREVAQTLLRRQPNFSLGQYEAAYLPFASGEQRGMHMAHLRAAMLPE